MTNFEAQAPIRNIVEEGYEDTEKEFSSSSMIDFIEYDEAPL